MPKLRLLAEIAPEEWKNQRWYTAAMDKIIKATSYEERYTTVMWQLVNNHGLLESTMSVDAETSGHSGRYVPLQQEEIATFTWDDWS